MGDTKTHLQGFLLNSQSLILANSSSTAAKASVGYRERRATKRAVTRKPRNLNVLIEQF